MVQTITLVIRVTKTIKDQLDALKQPKDSYSDVIQRLLDPDYEKGYIIAKEARQ